MAQGSRCPSVCVISSMHEVSVSFDLLLHHLHLPSLIPHRPQGVPVALLLPRGQEVTHCVLRYKEMVSTDETFSNTGFEPKNYDLMETYVESLTKSTTGQRFSEQRFFVDVVYDDATIGEMLFNAHRVHVYHSQREGLSVGPSSSSVSDRPGQTRCRKRSRTEHGTRTD